MKKGAELCSAPFFYRKALLLSLRRRWRHSLQPEVGHEVAVVLVVVRGVHDERAHTRHRHPEQRDAGGRRCVGLRVGLLTVRAGVLYSLTKLADSLGVATIWGEATASSAPFYEKVLQIRPVKDLFTINRETMERIQSNHVQKLRNNALRKS